MKHRIGRTRVGGGRVGRGRVGRGRVGGGRVGRGRVGRDAPGLRVGGLTMIEVLVGLAVLGVISGALVALQLGSLRAARTARETRQMAAAAEHQLTLARLWPALSGCRDLESWPRVDACELRVDCLQDGCRLRAVEVLLVANSGRESSWRTVVNDVLEEAPFGAAVESQDADGTEGAP